MASSEHDQRLNEPLSGWKPDPRGRRVWPPPDGPTLRVALEAMAKIASGDDVAPWIKKYRIREAEEIIMDARPFIANLKSTLEQLPGAEDDNSFSATLSNASSLLKGAEKEAKENPKDKILIDSAKKSVYEFVFDRSGRKKIKIGGAYDYELRYPPISSLPIDLKAVALSAQSFIVWELLSSKGYLEDYPNPFEDIMNIYTVGVSSFKFRSASRERYRGERFVGEISINEPSTKLKKMTFYA